MKSFITRSLIFCALIANASPALAVLIGHGADALYTTADTADGNGRTNTDRNSATFLPAYTYTVTNFNYTGANATSSVTPFLATSTAFPTYTPIWAGPAAVGVTGLNNINYTIGTQQFTIATGTTVYAGFASTGNNTVMLTTASGATDHNSPVLLPVVGVPQGHSNPNLVRTYAYGINVVAAAAQQTLIWNAGASGNWQDATWTGGPPSYPNANTVHATVDTPFTVNVGTTENIRSMTISNGGVVSVNAGGNLTAMWDTTATTGTLQLAGGGAFTGNEGTIGTVAGSGGAGTLNVTNYLGATGITVNAINDTGSGFTTFSKGGVGTLILAGAGNTSGQILLTTGVTRVTANNALGNTTGNTVVSSGAQLFLATTYTTAEALTLNGTGVTANGALRADVTNSYAGQITMGSDAFIVSGVSGQTLTLTGGINTNGFQARIGGSGTTTVNTVGISGTGSIQKTESGTLNLNVANSFSGQALLNAGTTQINVNDALGTSAGNTVVASGASMGLNTNYTTAEALTLNGTGTATNGALFATGNFGWAGAITLGTNAFVVSNTAGQVLTLSGGVSTAGFTARFGGAGTITVQTVGISGSGGIHKSESGVLNLNIANSYGGTTFVEFGTVNATVANSIGTGAVTVTGNATTAATLNLNAAGAAAAFANAITGNSAFNTINYNANTAVSGRTIFQTVAGGQTNISAAVTNLGTDKFNLVSGTLLSVPNSATAALLNRATNLTAANGAIIVEAALGSNAAIANLGTAQDLFFGIAANLNETVSVGFNTPWKGIASDSVSRTWAQGTITVEGTFEAKGVKTATLTLGNGTNTPTLSILAGGGGTVRRDMWISGGNVGLNAGGTGIGGETANYSGLNRVVVGNGAQLFASTGGTGNIFGGAGGSAKPIVEMLYGSVIDLVSTTAGSLNTNLYLRNGSRLFLNEATNLNGSGTIFADAGAIIDITAAGAVSTQTLNSVSPGAVVRMQVDNITALNTAFSPEMNYSLNGAAGNRTQNAGIVLSAGATPGGFVSGAIFNDGSTRSFVSSGGIAIGTGGGTLAATATTTLTISAAINVTGSGLRSLTIGTDYPIDVVATTALKSGTVQLSGTNNFGAGADRISQVNIRSGSVLIGNTSGLGNLPQGNDLALNLAGTYQINSAATATLALGNVTASGGGALYLNRTTGVLTVNLGTGTAGTGNIARTNRGTLQIRATSALVGGANEKVVFANAADAPARLSGVTQNMVAPWMYGTFGNVATFLDVDPAAATTTGFVAATYSVNTLAAAVSGDVINTAAVANAATLTMAALRTSGAISGAGTLNITTGGLLLHNNATAFSIANNINFGTAEGMIINASGGSHTLSGTISGSNGITKSGLNDLILNNTGNNFTGGITVAQGVLRPGVINGLGTGNAVNVLSGGTLNLIAFNQSITGLQGAGQVNNTSGTATLTLNVAGPDTFTFTGTARNDAGTLALTKTGAGKQILGGVLGYTGATTITDGTLVVNGNSTAISNYTVSGTGRLAGSGSILGNVAINSGGKLGPGNSPGILSTGSLTMASGSTLEIELNGALAGTGYDRVNVTGDVNITGATLSVTVGYTPTVGDKFFIIDNDSNDVVAGTFAGLAQGATLTVGAYQFMVSYQGDTFANANVIGNDVVLTVTSVPEPTSLALAGLGLAGLVVLRMRRRK